MERIALIVDDIELNRELLRDMLEEDYSILEASNGVEALDCIDKYGVDISVILLDIVMPVLDGFGVLEGLKSRRLIDRIPVLMISSEDVEAERRCFEYGVSDFVRKPFDERIVKRRVKINADICEYRNKLEALVEEQTAELVRRNEMLAAQTEKLRRSNDDLIEVLGSVVEVRNLESGQHIKRVKYYTRILADAIMERYPQYGLTSVEADVIVMTSPLHDVGKIVVPDAILLKPGRLTPEERKEMETHTLKGCEILDFANCMWNDIYYKTCWEICRWHHERYDGGGYPEGLAGEEIPISAQIVSLADVFDALTSERPYKKAFTREKAQDMILSGECGVFSPALLSCLDVLMDSDVIED